MPKERLQDIVGTNVRKFRTANKMSQAALAKKMKITPLAVSNLERNHTDISVSRLEKYSKVLGTDVFHLIKKGE